MSVNENIENNNESSFPNIKIIVLGVLLATSIIIGSLCYYFASNKKPSEQPVVKFAKVIALFAIM